MTPAEQAGDIPENESQHVRISLCLTDDAAAEIDRIKAETGMSVEKIFRRSFTLLRIYLDARRDGKQMRIYDAGNRAPESVIRFPEDD